MELGEDEVVRIFRTKDRKKRELQNERAQECCIGVPLSLLLNTKNVHGRRASTGLCDIREI